MTEMHKRVAAVTAVTLGDETTVDLTAGATLIELSNSGDFEGGGSVLIAGTVYTFSADTVEEGEDDDSPAPSITLDSGLDADAPAGTPVEVWDSNAGAVAVDYLVDVTDDLDGSPGQAYLHYTLIPMLPEGLPPGVGSSVTVRVDEYGDWWVVNVHGEAATLDPGTIRTGGLGADRVVWAGTENGRRAQLDGVDGALEAFNDANEQTVNIDGADNYISGTLATAKDGKRIEVGPDTGGLFVGNEARFYSGSDDELEPGRLRIDASEEDPGIEVGQVLLWAPGWDVPGTSYRPSLLLTTGRSDGLGRSSASVTADDIILTVGVGRKVYVINGALDATMGDGSVGTGTFRDSVDARVTAGAATAARLFAGTTATAAGTAAKTATISGYTPAAGDTLALTLTNGNTVASPTLNINGGGAKAIQLGGQAVGTVFGSANAGAIWALRYDGTVWHLAGAQKPNTDLVAIGSLSPSNDDILQRKAGAWANRTIAQLKTDLALAIADISGLQAALDALKPVTGGNAAFNSATNAVNTTGKYAGRPGFNSVTGIPIYASGPNATDVWKKYTDNTTAHTPV